MNEHTEWVTCNRCDGSGRVPDHDSGHLEGNFWLVEHTTTCGSCEGKGQVRQDVVEGKADA